MRAGEPEQAGSRAVLDNAPERARPPDEIAHAVTGLCGPVGAGQCLGAPRTDLPNIDGNRTADADWRSVEIGRDEVLPRDVLARELSPHEDHERQAAAAAGGQLVTHGQTDDVALFPPWGMFLVNTAGPFRRDGTVLPVAEMAERDRVDQ